MVCVISVIAMILFVVFLPQIGSCLGSAIQITLFAIAIGILLILGWAFLHGAFNG